MFTVSFTGTTFLKWRTTLKETSIPWRECHDVNLKFLCKLLHLVFLNYETISSAYDSTLGSRVEINRQVVVGKASVFPVNLSRNLYMNKILNN